MKDNMSDLLDWNDNNTSTTGTPLFALGNGEGLGSFVNCTVYLNPELDRFKREVIKRLKELPRQTYINGEITEVYGALENLHSEIEKLINWIERGTD